MGGCLEGIRGGRWGGGVVPDALTYWQGGKPGGGLMKLQPLGRGGGWRSLRPVQQGQPDLDALCTAWAALGAVAPPLPTAHPQPRAAAHPPHHLQPWGSSATPSPAQPTSTIIHSPARSSSCSARCLRRSYSGSMYLAVCWNCMVVVCPMPLFLVASGRLRKHGCCRAR